MESNPIASAPVKRGRVLRGAKKIAEYITHNHEPMNEAGVYYGAKTGKLPVRHDHKDLVSNTDRIDQHYSNITA
jgi:hypothetical protein